MELILGYLDPGTGSVVLQALLGGLAGLAVALKLFGWRVLSFLRIRRRSTEETKPVTAEHDAVR